MLGAVSTGLRIASPPGLMPWVRSWQYPPLISVDGMPRRAGRKLVHPKGTGCRHCGLHVATIRPKAHPDLAHSKQPNASAFVQGNDVNHVHSTVGGIGRQAIAQPVDPVCRCIPKTLRVCTAPQQPVLEHHGLNTAWASAARVTCSCFCNAFLIAVLHYGVKQVGSVKVGIEVIV